MKIVCVYIIISPTNKIYIGQSRNFLKRLNCYKNLRFEAQSKLYASFVKHGFDNHYKGILVTCEVKELNYWERFYISLLDTTDREYGLNLNSGGDSMFIVSDETKGKLRQSIVNNPSRIEASKKT